MKSLLRTAAAILATATLAFGSEGWMTDWEAAKAKSKEEKKPILICLTGSDWCGWCIKLEKEVFSKKEFQDFAKENLILMEADYPKKKEQPAELKKQNAALEKKFLKGGYPTVFLLDAEGEKLSDDLGEFGHDPEKWIVKLKVLIAKAKE